MTVFVAVMVYLCGDIKCKVFSSYEKADKHIDKVNNLISHYSIEEAKVDEEGIEE